MRLGRGVLGVITVMLVGSALIRLGAGSGAALARDQLLEEAPVPPAAEGCVPRAELEPMLTAFAEREASIAAEEERIAERLAALAAAEARLAETIAELEGAEAALAGTIARADTAAEEDLARLTAVYEAMKPKDAARLFETMAPEFAAGFLARMRPDAAAALFSGLPPETAYSVSVILAGRNARAGEPAATQPAATAMEAAR